MRIHPRPPNLKADIMIDFLARAVLPMLHGLSLKLAPLMTAQDGTELTRRVILILAAALIAGWVALENRRLERLTENAHAGAGAMPLGRRSTRAFAALLPMALAAVLLHPGVATADERAYLSKPEIESSLLGKPMMSRNLASGTLSHWEFRRDGSVEARRSGLGRAAGTWSVRDDGQMCVTLMNRTGCRYWFRKDEAYANADTRSPDAIIVAEVRFE